MTDQEALTSETISKSELHVSSTGEQLFLNFKYFSVSLIEKKTDIILDISSGIAIKAFVFFFKQCSQATEL